MENNAILTIDVTNAQVGGVQLGYATGLPGSGTLAFQGPTDALSAANVVVGANGATPEAGTLDMTNGGTLQISNAVIPTASESTFKCGTGTVDYNGPAQTVSPGDYYNLSLDGTGTKTISYSNPGGASPAVRIAGAFDINPAVTVDALTNQSNIEFNGTGAQTVPAIQYCNLWVEKERGANDVTFQPATIQIAGAFIPIATFTPPSGGTAGSYVVTGTTFEFDGPAAQTVPDMQYNNLVVASERGANDVTFQPGTIDIAGAFLPLATFTAPSGGTAGNYVVTGTTFDYNGAAQTVSSFIYDNLSLDGSGTKTISTSNSSGPSPAVAIAGDLTINPTVAVDTLSTKSNIEFIGTGAQTVP
ncbi:MAG: hypothetical protein ABSF26_31890, partial [Thermoguttaceae bacterium]